MRESPKDYILHNEAIYAGLDKHMFVFCRYLPDSKNTVGVGTLFILSSHALLSYGVFMFLSVVFASLQLYRNL